MTTAVIIGIAFGAFILGLIFSPKYKIECTHTEKFSYKNLESYKEDLLARENASLRHENSNLRWEYEKIRRYGGRECCEHCEKRMSKSESEKILKSIELAKVKAIEVVNDLEKIKQ